MNLKGKEGNVYVYLIGPNSFRMVLFSCSVRV